MRVHITTASEFGEEIIECEVKNGLVLYFRFYQDHTVIFIARMMPDLASSYHKVDQGIVAELPQAQRYPCQLAPQPFDLKMTASGEQPGASSCRAGINTCVCRSKLLGS